MYRSNDCPIITIRRNELCGTDSGYDDYKLYDVSRNRGFAQVCPVKRYEHTPPP